MADALPAGPPGDSVAICVEDGVRAREELGNGLCEADAVLVGDFERAEEALGLGLADSAVPEMERVAVEQGVVWGESVGAVAEGRGDTEALPEAEGLGERLPLMLVVGEREKEVEPVLDRLALEQDEAEAHPDAERLIVGLCECVGERVPVAEKLEELLLLPLA